MIVPKPLLFHQLLRRPSICFPLLLSNNFTPTPTAAGIRKAAGRQQQASAMSTDQSYAFGPYKIHPKEVFYSTDHSYAMVNLRPLLPGS
ncbi:Bifunctional bis(5'-adenosyl)-triphosphatase/adenylylsulfatase FHIT [Linum perenne]